MYDDDDEAQNGCRFPADSDPEILRQNTIGWSSDVDVSSRASFVGKPGFLGHGWAWLTLFSVGVWHDVDCSRCEFHFGIDTHGLWVCLRFPCRGLSTGPWSYIADSGSALLLNGGTPLGIDGSVTCTHHRRHGSRRWKRPLVWLPLEVIEEFRDIRRSVQFVHR
jgi:hypothetical protein